MEGEEGFAGVQVTVEERDAYRRKPFLPEPADGLGFGFGGSILVDGKGDREFVDRGFVLLQEGFECGGV